MRSILGETDREKQAEYRRQAPTRPSYCVNNLYIKKHPSGDLKNALVLEFIAWLSNWGREWIICEVKSTGMSCFWSPDVSWGVA